MFDLSLQWLVVAVDVSVKAVLLAGTAALVLWLPRLADSNLRHRVWTGVLIGMLLLPALSQTVPALQLPFALPDAWKIGAWEPSTPLPQAAAAAPSNAVDASHTPLTQFPPQPFADFPSNEEFSRGVAPFASSEFEFDAEFAPAAPVTDTTSPTARDSAALGIGEPTSVPATGAAPPASMRLSFWPVALLGLWLVGTGLMALRLMAGLAYALRLVRCSTPITSAELIELGVDPRSLAGEKRSTPIGECPLIRVPLALGVVRPRVLLPSDWLAWPAEKLQAVIAHERTHIERGDGAVIFLAELNRCLYWFHPLAWWLRTHLGTLAETACDDAAIDATGDRTTYARHLLEVAATVSAHRSRLLTPGISMARHSHVETRINTILDLTRPLSKRLTWTTTLLLAAALIPLITLAAAVRPMTSTEPEQRDEQIVTAGMDIDAQGTGKRAAPDAQTDDAQPPDVAAAADEQTPGGIGEAASETPSYSGNVTMPDGEPIAGAGIWLAITSYHEDADGTLKALGKSDEQGRFHVVLDVATAEEIRRWLPFGEPHLVATAAGRGLDWLPLDVFEDNAAPSEQRDLQQARIDQSLGAGRFASRTLKLRPEARPIRGRLVDLEGHPLPNVTMLVESLRQPDIPRLLKAFEKSWKQEVYEALSATSVGVGGLARSELQKLIPPVTTDENGDFELRGIGDDQLVTLVFDADRVEARPLYVLGREMETVSLPHIEHYPGGAKDVFVGRDFTYAVGPSVPVEGVVTDYDTGEPVAGVLVYVERLFKEGSVNHEQLRLDTHHMRAVTDGHGRFRITGIPPGEGHVLEAVPRKSEPYLMTSQDVSPSLEDGDAKRIEIQVKRGIWIEGRVTDKQSGEPLLATVAYMALRKNSHALDKLGLDQAWDEQRYGTDSDGRYRALGLPGPGVLFVTSQVPGYPLEAGAETIDGYDASNGVIPTTPFPLRVSNWHLLKQIDPAADAISLTCDLVLDAGDSIPGRVVGPDGKPTSDLYVLGQTDGDEYWRPRHDDNVRMTDRFTVYDYDGKGPRQLFFKNQDETLVGQYRLEGAAPEEIVVTLQPCVRVTGRLIENETDLPAARYFLLCEICSLFNEKYPPVKFMIHWCHTNDEGRFEIKGLMAGLVYKMNALNESNFANNRNRFTIDLTDVNPGDVLELGDVTGPNSHNAGNRGKAMEKTEAAPRSYTGRVATPEGEPIAGAKIWLAMTSYEEDGAGLLHALGTADERGRFQVVLDAAAAREVHKRISLWQAQLVATAAGRGFDWMPLDVFDDNPTPSDNRDTLQAVIDQSLGAGRFAGRTLKLRPESRPIRGRLIDLDGHPLSNVTVLVESLRQPHIPLLLKAFEESSKEGVFAAWNATGIEGLSRGELQQLIPPVTTDENGAFELAGIGDDQLVTLTFSGERVEAQVVQVLGRTMETVRLPHISSYPNGAKEVYAGRDFIYAIGPSVPVEGVVKDYDTGEPVARTFVSVERLFSEHGGADEGQLRVDTRHMRTVTDEQGRFRITGMPPGIGHVLEAVPPKSEPYLMASQDVSLSLDDGDAKVIEIQVKKGIWIEGRVTDKQSGEPLSGAVDYMALRKNPHTLDKLGLKQAWQFHRYRIGSDGRYRTLGLPGPGVVLVQAEGGYPRCVGAESVDGYEASKGGGYIPTTPFVWPLTNWNFIKQIDPAADATSFMCDVVLDGGQSVPGRVVGPDGESIAGLNVLGEVVNVAFWKLHSATTFTVEGYDGTGPRQLFFKNKAETLVGQYRLEGDAPEEIVVTLEPAVRVTGRLIENETDLRAQRYGLHCDDTTVGKFRIDDCRTDDEGRFEIKGLVAGIVYNMNAANERHFVSNRNRFTIDLTDARPGDVIELGDVTGPNSDRAMKN